MLCRNCRANVSVSHTHTNVAKYDVLNATQRVYIVFYISPMLTHSHTVFHHNNFWLSSVFCFSLWSLSCERHCFFVLFWLLLPTQSVVIDFEHKFINKQLILFFTDHRAELFALMPFNAQHEILRYFVVPSLSREQLAPFFFSHIYMCRRALPSMIRNPVLTLCVYVRDRVKCVFLLHLLFVYCMYACVHVCVWACECVSVCDVWYISYDRVE